jgi:hypothetical protein
VKRFGFLRIIGAGAFAPLARLPLPSVINKPIVSMSPKAIPIFVHGPSDIIMDPKGELMVTDTRYLNAISFQLLDESPTARAARWRALTGIVGNVRSSSVASEVAGGAS